MLQLHSKRFFPSHRVAADRGFQAKLPAPFAVLGIRTFDGQLTGIEYLPRAAAVLAPNDALTAKVCRQIECYLDDPEYRFDLPLAIEGTRFQRRVWEVIA